MTIPKEYEQNHNTIEPAPLGIEPNMICIETQQTSPPENRLNRMILALDFRKR